MLLCPDSGVRTKNPVQPAVFPACEAFAARAALVPAKTSCGSIGWSMPPARSQAACRAQPFGPPRHARHQHLSTRLRTTHRGREILLSNHHPQEFVDRPCRFTSESSLRGCMYVCITHCIICTNSRTRSPKGTHAKHFQLARYVFCHEKRLTRIRTTLTWRQLNPLSPS